MVLGLQIWPCLQRESKSKESKALGEKAWSRADFCIKERGLLTII